MAHLLDAAVLVVILHSRLLSFSLSFVCKLPEDGIILTALNELRCAEAHLFGSRFFLDRWQGSVLPPPPPDCEGQ
jgi:hypothetical protein